MKGLIWLVVLIIIVILAFVLVGGGEEVAATEQTFEVTINNVSDTQPLSPGVIVVHTDRFNLNYEGELSPEELEPLAEWGDNTSYLAFVEGARGVEQVININSPILPGTSATFEVTVPTEDDDLRISVLQMLVASNDAIAVVDGEDLFEAGEGRSFTVLAMNYDNGTEENEPLGSGFEGGQPDPARSHEENEPNGTPTDPQEKVSLHEDATETVLELVVSAGEVTEVEAE